MNHRRLIGLARPWMDVWARCFWAVQVHVVTGEARVTDPADAVRASGLEADCLEFAARAAPFSTARRDVVLLHGLANDPGSTSRAARALSEGGAGAVSFYGHSLGGLIARAAIARAESDAWTPGRLVLVGSPARGAAIAAFASRLRSYRALAGACGQSVTPAGAADIPLPGCADTGVIAGGTGRRGFNPLLHGDNDGIVTVDETRLPGSETDFLLLRALHTPLASSSSTIAAALGFLETGRFHSSERT